MLVVIILLIHLQFREAHSSLRSVSTISLVDVQKVFPDAVRLRVEDTTQEIYVFDGPSDSEHAIGYVIQTSPASDEIIGFSGPTNVLLGFDMEGTLVGFDVLSSGDTRDHLAEVMRDTRFMSSLDGKTDAEISSMLSVEGVSGATLTSLAIHESIVRRLGGEVAPLRFPHPITAEQLRKIFPEAVTITEHWANGLMQVRSVNDVIIGHVLRSSPAADHTIGFQGPTDSFVCFAVDGRIEGLIVGESYDNEPYVGYVRDDRYFLKLFNDMTVDDLANVDLDSMRVEGVSGATMTSMAVAEGIVVAARKHVASTFPYYDLATGCVVVMAFMIAFTNLRSKKWVRIPFQICLVVYVGLIAGHLLSQAMFVGWARTGLPWRNAPALVMLAIAAFSCPIFTKRNIYCSHLCPHGAAQQLLKRRLPWQWKLGRAWTRILSVVPAMLLLWCLIVAIGLLQFSLVDIEPFDAYLFRIAGLATISVAIIGLIASLFIPMAYCRFGCPTGRLLEFLRFNARSDQWTIRDWITTSYLIIAIVIWRLV